MRTIITDIEVSLDQNDYVFYDNVSPCKGCFHCWTKNNYKCILNDYVADIGNKMLESDEIIIITKCINGSYSSKVKRILERSISFVKPYFTKRNNEIHHLLRSNRIIPCTIIVYNEISKQDKNTFEKLVHANNVNFASWKIKTIYVDSVEKVGEYL